MKNGLMFSKKNMIMVVLYFDVSIQEFRPKSGSPVAKKFKIHTIEKLDFKFFFQFLYVFSTFNQMN